MKTVNFHDYKINICISEYEEDKDFLNSIYTLINNNELIIREKGMPYIYSKLKLDGNKLFITNICSLGFSYEGKELFFKLDKAAPIEHIHYEKDPKRNRFIFYNTVNSENRVTRNFRKFKIDLPSSVGNLYLNSTLTVLCNVKSGVLLLIDKVGLRDFITNMEISTYILEDNTLKVDFVLPHLSPTPISNDETTNDAELAVNEFCQNSCLKLGNNMQILSSETGNEAILLQDINVYIRNLYVGAIKYNHLNSSLLIQEYYYSALLIKDDIITFYGHNVYPKGFFDSLFSEKSKNIEIYYKEIDSKALRFIEESDWINVVNPNKPKKRLATINIQSKNEIRIYTYTCSLEISKDKIIFIED